MNEDYLWYKYHDYSEYPDRCIFEDAELTVVVFSAWNKDGEEMGPAVHFTEVLDLGDCPESFRKQARESLRDAGGLV